ncbi:MAG: hypothetical protein KC609_19050 [Myxococcales bacterium]|nr:hypothetical protein [Myxococcales bacterium]
MSRYWKLFLLSLGCLAFAACSAESRCPQGTVSVGGRCYLEPPTTSDVSSSTDGGDDVLGAVDVVADGVESDVLDGVESDVLDDGVEPDIFDEVGEADRSQDDQIGDDATPDGTDQPDAPEADL